MCDVKVNCLQGNVCRKAITLFGKSFFTNEHFSLCIQHTPGLKLFMMKIFHIPPFMCECVDSCAFSALPLSVKSGSVTLSSSVYVLFVLWNCRLGLQFAWHMTQPESHNSFSPPIQNSSSYTACRFIGPLQLKPNGYAATFSKNSSQKPAGLKGIMGFVSRYLVFTAKTATMGGFLFSFSLKCHHWIFTQLQMARLCLNQTVRTHLADHKSLRELPVIFSKGKSYNSLKNLIK